LGTEISALLIKELRDKTGVGIMDCKKALKECDGDIEQAVDYLRRKSQSLKRGESALPLKVGFSHISIRGVRLVSW